MLGNPVASEVVKTINEKVIAGIDYGEAYWNSSTKTVFWVGGDADGEETTDPDEIRRLLLEIDGVEHVEAEAEVMPAEIIEEDQHDWIELRVKPLRPLWGGALRDYGPPPGAGEALRVCIPREPHPDLPPGSVIVVGFYDAGYEDGDYTLEVDIAAAGDNEGLFELLDRASAAHLSKESPSRVTVPEEILEVVAGYDPFEQRLVTLSPKASEKLSGWLDQTTEP